MQRICGYCVVALIEKSPDLCLKEADLWAPRFHFHLNSLICFKKLNWYVPPPDKLIQFPFPFLLLTFIQRMSVTVSVFYLLSPMIHHYFFSSLKSVSQLMWVIHHLVWCGTDSGEHWQVVFFLSVYKWVSVICCGADVSSSGCGWTWLDIALFVDCCFNWKSGQLQSYQFDSEFSPSAVRWKMRKTSTATAPWKLLKG